MRRIEPFIYSRRNIVGTLLALGGLAMYFLGITSGPVGLVVVPALYAIGYLLTSPERGIALRLDQARDVGEVREGLDRLLDSIRMRVAEDIYGRVQSIRDSIVFTLEKAEHDTADPNIYLIRQTALAYLPEALSSYLAVPRLYAERRAVADGRTPHDVLLEQLDLMDSKMREVAEDVVRNDSQKLIAHGRFLRERFASSSLELAPAEAQREHTR